MMILLLQVKPPIEATLLMRSGDVERNPGPGLYPGEFLSVKYVLSCIITVALFQILTMMTLMTVF